MLGTFTTFQQRLLYDVWDVTALVSPGCNTLGVMLGNGWYSQPTIHAGPLSLLVLISVDTADGARTYYSSSSATPFEDTLTRQLASPASTVVRNSPHRCSVTRAYDVSSHDFKFLVRFRRE